MTARFVVQAPGGDSQDFPLEKPITVLGRDRECDLVLDYDYVSRHHVRVEHSGSDYAIMDMDSTNGTFLNGQRVEGNALSAAAIASTSGTSRSLSSMPRPPARPGSSGR